MHKILICLTAVAVIGGCTSEWDTGKAAVATVADPAGHRSQGAKTSASSQPARASDSRLPDRGNLIAYDRSRPAFRRAAFTYHAVGLSEAHALNAARRGGKVELQTPSGKTLSFAYERHVEHRDGNWTWVGRTQDGLDAVITFGSDAVFGRIAQANTEPLQLTYTNGRTWLVEADPSKLRHPGSRLPLDHDVAVVPRAALEAMRNRQSAKPAAKGAISANAAEAATGPANTVDVVLGYTPGLVSQNGGSTSAVVTLLTNRIELTNQALASSLVTPRVRLVRTVQVNYTDTTTNSATLDALSGQSCTATSCTSIPVPAELQPLRDARETYGGDIVSLVRPLKEPEHNGCGIAWLLGPNNTTIDNTDALFAYSVVSNGSDVRESDGFTYSCPVETLAHEMAHNMGQQHNVEDSGGDAGTHPYSYGFRETATNGFYTIMAYPLASSSQFSVAYFGNPNVNYAAGRPTGSANADNARSMNQSMLLVAQFRSTLVPFSKRPRNDFDGDGKSDMGWWNAAGGYFSYWKMDGFNFVSANNYFFGIGQEPTSTGRPSGNVPSEILMRRTSDKSLTWFRPSASGQIPFPLGNYADPWVIVGQGDVDGDSKDDLFWRNSVTGAFAYWRMDGSTFLGAQTYATTTAFNIAAISDFNGDGKADILWDAPSGPSMSVWLSVGAGFDVKQIGAYSTEWRVLGAGDVDGDGNADILWRNSSNTYLAYWRMNGGTFLASNATPTPTDITFQTTGDYNGDGLIDIIWTRNSDQQVQMWLGNGVNFGGYIIGASSTAWALVK